MNQHTDTVFRTDDISLVSYFLTQGASLIDIVADRPNHFSFLLSDLDKCNNLKRQFLNNAVASAQELFSKREMLIAEIKSCSKVAQGATVMRA